MWLDSWSEKWVKNIREGQNSGTHTNLWPPSFLSFWLFWDIQPSSCLQCRGSECSDPVHSTDSWLIHVPVGVHCYPSSHDPSACVQHLILGIVPKHSVVSSPPLLPPPWPPPADLHVLPKLQYRLYSQGNDCPLVCSIKWYIKYKKKEQKIQM